ncbi:hypothetical protein EV141_1194 [Microcella putealis]|uniref:DUF6458 domain-containing protein n=1 Tax=Microcella putealis TaxID=337005 RepID=A0A4Q7LSI8_9MICO|nr:DUF6458 family protein [Microcella putealis]RZS57481.1 hypothetical protein EV141_1194 [Microcella putealis]TQM24548.1 hypothetical protein BJ957_0803 [Microcella putealis]
MSIGFGIFLFVVGAILAFAINVAVEGVELLTIGYILMGAGVITVIIGVALMMRRRSAVTTERSGVDPASGERVTRRESSIDDPPVA